MSKINDIARGVYYPDNKPTWEDVGGSNYWEIDTNTDHMVAKHGWVRAANGTGFIPFSDGNSTIGTAVWRFEGGYFNFLQINDSAAATRLYPNSYELEGNNRNGVRFVSDDTYGYLQAGSFDRNAQQKMRLSGIKGAQLHEITIHGHSGIPVANYSGYFRSAWLHMGGYADHYRSVAPFFYEVNTTSSSEWHSFCKGRISKPGQTTKTWSFGAIVGGDGAGRAQIIGSSNASDAKYWSFNLSDGSASAIAWNATSDIQFKEGIVPISVSRISALDKIQELNPVTWRWKKSYVEDRSTQMGFVAQELIDVIPEAVTSSEGIVNKETMEQGEILSINSTPIIAVLVQAVKELRGQTDKLSMATNPSESTVDRLSQEVASLKADVVNLTDIVLTLQRAVLGAETGGTK